MYRVYVNDQTASYPLYEPLDDELRIFAPVLTQEMGKAGSFEFHIMANHPYANKIGLLKSEVIVYDDDEEVFHGRVLKPEYAMNNLVSVICEGDFTYLLDSLQRPYEIEGTISQFLTQVLNVHNSQVDDYKKIQLGTVTVTNTSGNDVWTNSKISTTMEALKAVANAHEGYFRVRNVSGIKYLDYLWDYGGINSQVIRFGENLLDLSKYLDATTIVTCLVPLGADVEYVDSLGEKQAKTIDITSVNGGIDYIQNDAAIELYGKVWGMVTWGDVTEPENLLAKARAYLQEVSALPASMEVNAVDLSLIDENVQEFRLGYWTDVSSMPHGIEKQFLLTKRVINLLDPTAGSITLGRTAKSFTEGVTQKQQEAIKAVEKVAESASSEINRKVENATNLITGGLGGYVVLDNVDPSTGEKIHPWRILIMNTPDKDTARNVIQFNQNGIGFSTTGINGPYRNAWTIDGNLVADFITTGTMLADRIRGGILEVGGSGVGRDGRILVKDANDNMIGYWDRTGLHVLRGEIRGTDIFGSNIEGGTIDIGNGLFMADSEAVYFGDYFISTDGSNLFRASDGSVVLQTASGGPLGSYTNLKLSSGSGETNLSDHHISTKSVEAGSIWGSCVLANGNGVTNWWAGYSLYDALDYLYNKIENLE